MPIQFNQCNQSDQFIQYDHYHKGLSHVEEFLE